MDTGFLLSKAGISGFVYDGLTYVECCFSAQENKRYKRFRKEYILI